MFLGHALIADFGYFILELSASFIRDSVTANLSLILNDRRFHCR